MIIAGARSRGGQGVHPPAREGHLPAHRRRHRALLAHGHQHHRQHREDRRQPHPQPHRQGRRSDRQGRNSIELLKTGVLA